MTQVKQSTRSATIRLVACVLFAVCVLAVSGCVGGFTGGGAESASESTREAQREVCFTNERNIDMASQAYYTDQQTFAPNLETLAQSGMLAEVPKCPGGGTYALDPSNGEVRCSVHGRY